MGRLVCEEALPAPSRDHVPIPAPSNGNNLLRVSSSAVSKNFTLLSRQALEVCQVVHRGRRERPDQTDVGILRVIAAVCKLLVQRVICSCRWIEQQLSERASSSPQSYTCSSSTGLL